MGNKKHRLVGAPRFELGTSCAQGRRSRQSNPPVFNVTAETKQLSRDRSMWLAVPNCAHLSVGWAQKLAQSRWRVGPCLPCRTPEQTMVNVICSGLDYIGMRGRLKIRYPLGVGPAESRRNSWANKKRIMVELPGIAPQDQSHRFHRCGELWCYILPGGWSDT